MRAAALVACASLVACSGSTSSAPSTPSAARAVTSSAPSASASATAIACPSTMVTVPAGRFVSAASKREVAVATHCLDRTEVTVAAYRACVDGGACTPADAWSEGDSKRKACNWGRAGYERHPINCVDHHQAEAYCRFAQGRLPSEVEWEWSARDYANAAEHPWGHDPPRDRVCWNGDDDGLEEGRDGTCAVDAHPRSANSRGVVDLIGNVWEWTSTKALDDAHKWIDRGGGWLNNAPAQVAISARNGVDADGRYSSLGFRCAR